MRTRDVAVLILHDHGKILLQKRPKDAVRFPDSWGLFGGGVKEGETVERALKREVFEEAGLVIDAALMAATHPYALPEKGEQGTVHVCVVRYEGQPLALREGQELMWLEPGEAVKLVGHEVYKDIIREIVQGRISMVS